MSGQYAQSQYFFSSPTLEGHELKSVILNYFVNDDGNIVFCTKSLLQAIEVIFNVHPPGIFSDEVKKLFKRLGFNLEQYLECLKINNKQINLPDDTITQKDALTLLRLMRNVTIVSGKRYNRFKDFVSRIGRTKLC